MSEANDYFVNRLEDENGVPFYMGYSYSSSRLDRYLSHLRYAKRELTCNLQPRKNEVIVRMLDAGLKPGFKKLAERLTKREALICERETIAKIGRRDLGKGPLANCHPGGASPNLKISQ